MSRLYTLSVDHLPHGAEVESPFDGRALKIIRLDSIIDKNSMDWRTTHVCNICPYQSQEECSKTSCTGRIITTPETFALMVLTERIEAP